MVEKKAPLLMIRAYAQVRTSVPDAELVMIGDGPLLESAKRLAGNLSIPVKFLGACSSDEVLAHMHEARVFCLPSITAANGDAEGFGMVLLEAGACGLPVVSSARGGAAEGIIEGQTGFSFQEWNIKELVTALISLLVDDALCDRMFHKASSFMQESFNIHQQTTELEALYERAPACPA